MIAIVFIVFFFRKKAVDFELSTWLWPILGVAAYFIMQLLFGFVIGFLTPSLLDDSLLITVVGIITGALGVGIVYLIMKRQAQQAIDEKGNSNLLDN